MKTLAVWTLVVVNVLLGSALFARFGKQNTAFAQAGRPSDYVMITGELSATNNAVVYLLDTTNGQLGGLLFDPSRGRFDPLLPLDLPRFFDQGVQSGGQQGGNNRPRR